MSSVSPPPSLLSQALSKSRVPPPVSCRPQSGSRPPCHSTGSCQVTRDLALSPISLSLDLPQSLDMAARPWPVPGPYMHLPCNTCHLSGPCPHPSLSSLARAPPSSTVSPGLCSLAPPMPYDPLWCSIFRVSGSPAFSLCFSRSVLFPQSNGHRSNCPEDTSPQIFQRHPTWNTPPHGP